jgi:hypothetical protein
MEAIIEKRLNGPIWRELSLEQGRREQYTAREFMVQNTDGTMRGVADLSHLSGHQDSLATKAETPRGIFCRFDAWGSNAFDEFAQRVQSFQAASGYAEIFYCEDSDGRWQRALFSVSCASIWMEPFWLLVLEISAEILDYCQEDARLSCFELCRRLRACSISRPPCIIGRLSKSVAVFGRASLRYGLTRHPSKGVRGDGPQCLQRLGFVVDTVRGLFGIPAKKLDAISSFARHLLTRARTNRRLVRKYSLESFIGKAQSMRLAVPDTASHLRALYECVPATTTASMPLTFLGKRCQTSTRTARLSHPASKDLENWRDIPNQLHDRPIWPEVSKPTVTIHRDASMTAYGATLALGEQEAGAKDFYECRGDWEGSHLNKAHITLLELATVRLCLKDFLQRCVLRRDAVIKLYTDNMVTMFVVNKWVWKSPVIIAELRCLHQLCKRHGLELELNHLPSSSTYPPTRCRGGGEWRTIFCLWMGFWSIGGSGIQGTTSSWIGSRWICCGRR